MAKEKVPWGVIGPPGSEKRNNYLSSIRKKKRNTKKKIEAKATKKAADEIEVIEAPVCDIELQEENPHEPAPPVKKATREIQVKEKKKRESPGEPGELYVTYPY